MTPRAHAREGSQMHVDFLQWPAMALPAGASWKVGSGDRRIRAGAFWLSLLSNALWMVWGWADRAFALVLLQFLLAFMNIRGAAKAEP